MRILLIGIGLVALAATTAVAQPSGDSRFVVTADGGVGMGANRTGGALGGSFGVALSKHFTGEFETVYLDRGPGVTGLSFEGRLQISLLPPDGRFVPQVTVGGAAYQSHFDMGSPQMFGRFAQMTPQQFGSMMGTTTMPFSGTLWRPGQPVQGQHGSMWTVVNPNGVMLGINMPQIPMFYAQRMGFMGVGTNGYMGNRTFTDPALVFGGGVTINATEHLFVRPEARALMVIGDGDTYTIGIVTARVGFRF